jgi:hypothetical protein
MAFERLYQFTDEIKAKFDGFRNKFGIEPDLDMRLCAFVGVGLKVGLEANFKAINFFPTLKSIPSISFD